MAQCSQPRSTPAMGTREGWDTIASLCAGARATQRSPRSLRVAVGWAGICARWLHKTGLMKVAHGAGAGGLGCGRGDENRAC